MKRVRFYHKPNILLFNKNEKVSNLKNKKNNKNKNKNIKLFFNICFFMFIFYSLYKYKSIIL